MNIKQIVTNFKKCVDAQIKLRMGTFVMEHTRILGVPIFLNEDIMYANGYFDVPNMMMTKNGDIFVNQAMLNLGKEVLEVCVAHELGHKAHGHMEKNTTLIRIQQAFQIKSAIEYEIEADAYAASMTSKRAVKRALLFTMAAINTKPAKGFYQRMTALREAA